MESHYELIVQLIVHILYGPYGKSHYEWVTLTTKLCWSYYMVGFQVERTVCHQGGEYNPCMMYTNLNLDHFFVIMT